MKKFSLICCCNNVAVLNENLLAANSPAYTAHEIIIKFFPKHICAALNEGTRQATGDYLIFVHQDVRLPETFFIDLNNAIEALESSPLTSPLGVIGPAGRDALGVHRGWINDRGDLWGDRDKLPHPVQTLDELMLVVPRELFLSESISFDEAINNHHLFGSDLCLQAAEQGYRNFAINAFVFHNSSGGYELPKEFWESAAYLKKKWGGNTIFSTCAVI
jgi:glycosyltransferase involved in cell wall biosynthesis